MAEFQTVSLKWKDLLENLALLTRGAYRFVQSNGRVEEAGREGPICHRLREVRGADFCRQHCWVAQRCGEQGDVSHCAGRAAQVALPVRLGGQLLGHLFFGDFRLTDDRPPSEADSTWQSLQELTGLSLEQLQTGFQELKLRSSSELHDQLRSLKQLLEEQLLDNVLELTIREVKGYVIALSREELWQKLEDAARRVAPVDKFEIFTVAPNRDAITRERPEQWNEHDQIADFLVAEPEGYAVLPDGRLIVCLMHDGRLLAVFRLQAREPTGFHPKDIHRLRQLADGIAEALYARRQRKAQEILDQLNEPLNQAEDHRERLQILLDECQRVLGCQTGEVLLREPNKADWFQVVARSGIQLKELPSQSSAKSGLVARVMKNASTIVVTDTSRDPEFSSQRDASSVRGVYDEKIERNYREYLNDIKACVKIPLKMGQRIEGILCLHRNVTGPFYLGLVHVLELVAERIALELNGVLATETYSQRAEQLRNKISPREELLDKVRGLDAGAARAILFDDLSKSALSMSGAYRAAVCVINPEWTKVSVTAKAGADGGWPPDFMGTTIDVSKEDSAVTEAIHKGKNYVVEDVLVAGVKFFRTEPDHTRSTANIRLQCGSILLGVLDVEWKEPRAFDTVLIEALDQLASRYADVIHQFDVTHQMLRFEELLKGIDESGEPKYRELLESAARMLGVAEGAIFVRNHDTDLFQLRHDLVDFEKANQPNMHYELGEGLTGWIIANNRSVLLRDLHDKAEMRREAPGAVWKNKIRDNRDAEDRPTSFVGVPLAIGDEVLGVIRFNIATNWRPFDLVDKALTESIASRLAARLYELDEKRRGQALIGLLERIPHCQGTDEFSKSIFAALQTGLGVCAAHIRLMNQVQFGACAEDYVLLRVFAQAPDWAPKSHAGHESVWQMPTLMQDRQTGASGWVWREGKTLIDQDVRADESLSRRVGTLPFFLAHVGAMVVVPLHWDDRFVGTLHVYRPQRNSFSSADIRFVEKLGSVTAIGLQSLEVREKRELELGLHSLADKFVTDALAPQPKSSLQRDLCEQLLSELLLRLGGEQGWLLWPDESGTEFGIIDAGGADVIDGQRLEAEIIRQKIGKQGYRHVLRIGNDPDVEMWLRGWKKGNWYVNKANDRQTLLIAMEADDRLLAAFCIIARTEEAIRSDRIKQAKEVLDVIAREVMLATTHLDEQRRFENAAEPLAMIGAMYSGMEHALRSPVNNLVKHLELLTVRPRSSEEIQERLMAMRGQVGVLDEQTRVMLSIARQDSFSRIPLRPILEAALNQLNPKIDDALLQATYPEKDVYTRGSSEMLTNAFGFVLKNAWEATHQMSNGQIELTLDQPSDGMCRITISDNGPGMSEKARLNALRPWYSTKGATRGLGLPAAYLLVRYHRGRMEIQTAVGKGTSVVISLPTEERNQT